MYVVFEIVPDIKVWYGGGIMEVGGEKGRGRILCGWLAIVGF